MGIYCIGWKDLDWVDLVRDLGRWRAPTNFLVSLESGRFVINPRTIRFSSP